MRTNTTGLVNWYTPAEYIELARKRPVNSSSVASAG
jgi:hypothetical protein